MHNGPMNHHSVQQGLSTLKETQRQVKQPKKKKKRTPIVQFLNFPIKAFIALHYIYKQFTTYMNTKNLVAKPVSRVKSYYEIRSDP